MSLPLIRIANLNIWWTNGSRTKPGTPIPIEIREQFEEKEDYKINWLSDVTGLITLKGEYNYLLFKGKSYFLVKSGVIDIEKEIYIYTLTLDYWMSFISNSNNYVQGCLIKTSDEPLIWDQIQRTNAALSEVNSETVLKVCTSGECGKNTLKNQLEIVPFKRDEDENIVQFGYKYRFGKKSWKSFIDKLRQQYHQKEQKPNKIYAFCPLIKVPNWENYIASLIEDFFKNLDDVVIGTVTPTNLNSFSSRMSTALRDVYGFSTTYFSISKKNLQHVTISPSNDLLIKKIDFAKIIQIRYVKTQTLEDETTPNKSVFHLFDDPKFKAYKTDNTTWELKNKMYSPQDIEHTYKGYLNIGPIQKQNYELNNDLLEASNLNSINPTYKEHGFNFDNTNVPAIFYYSWLDVIDNNELKNYVRQNKISTEMGFLLYKVADYANTVLDAPNKHVYKGVDIYITIGLTVSDDKLLCNEVIDIETNKPIAGASEYAAFSEVYRTELEKSLWLTLLSVYLWQGELDRVFVGLFKGGILDDFKYTLPKCFSKGKNLLTIKKPGDEDEDKLPTYEEVSLSWNRNKETYKEALKDVSNRRKSMELNQPLINIPINEGDIYFNSAQHGYYDEENKEIEFKDPCLVVYSEAGYNYNKGSQQIWSLKGSDSRGFKIGILDRLKPLDVIPLEKNIIKGGHKLPYIYYLKPTLINQPTGLKHNRERFERDLNYFFRDYLRNPNTYKRWGSDNWQYSINIETSRDINVGIYDKNRTEWWNNDINIKRNWYKTSLNSNDLATIWRARSSDDEKYVYIDFLENDWTQKICVYLTLWKAGGFFFFNRVYYTKYVVKYIQNNLLHSNYLEGTTKMTSTSVDSIEQVTNTLLLPDQATFNKPVYKKHLEDWRPGSSYHSNGCLYRIIRETYHRVNNDIIADSSQTFKHIDEAFLRSEGAQGTKLVFELRTQGGVLFFAIIHWPSGAKEPTIQLIIADNTLIVQEEAATTLVLSKGTSTSNSNLVQVVNQQNFLYVHGHTFPIKTKIIGIPYENDFIFRVTNILKEDAIQSHYLVYFEGARDLIKTNISVVKKELKNITGPSTQELVKMRWEMAENAKNRYFDQLKQKEEERKTGVFLRHKEEDINWDETTGKSLVVAQSALGIIGSVAGAVAGGFATGGAGLAFGGLGVANSVSGATSSILKYNRGIEVAKRDLGEQTIQQAFNIEQSKNTLEHRHKYEELRDKNRLYESINTVINSVPNNADVLEALQRIDLIEGGIAIYNRMPTGELLGLLTEYHKNWGYDITVNNYSLTVNNLDKHNTIYQFSRIDYVSIDDINIKEAITNIFTNGIYLIQKPYELKNITLTTYKEIRRTKQVKQLIEETVKEQERREKELAVLRAQAEGAEKAKKDFKDVLKQRDANREALLEKNNEINRLKTELEGCKTKELAFIANTANLKQDYDIKITRLENNEEHQECKRQLEEKEALLTNEQAKTEQQTQVIQQKDRLIETKTNELNTTRETNQTLTTENTKFKNDLDAKTRELDIEKRSLKDLNAKLTNTTLAKINVDKALEAEKAKTTKLTTDLQTCKDNNKKLRGDKEALTETAQDKAYKNLIKKLNEKRWDYTIAMNRDEHVVDLNMCDYYAMRGEGDTTKLKIKLYGIYPYKRNNHWDTQHIIVIENLGWFWTDVYQISPEYDLEISTGKKYYEFFTNPGSLILLPYNFAELLGTFTSRHSWQSAHGLRIPVGGPWKYNKTGYTTDTRLLKMCGKRSKTKCYISDNPIQSIRIFYKDPNNNSTKSLSTANNFFDKWKEIEKTNKAVWDSIDEIIAFLENNKEYYTKALGSAEAYERLIGAAYSLCW